MNSLKSHGRIAVRAAVRLRAAHGSAFELKRRKTPGVDRLPNLLYASQEVGVNQLAVLRISFDKSSARTRPSRPSPVRVRSYLPNVIFLVIVLTALPASAQTSAGPQATVRGIVINSVTREPVGHALVYSIDQRFATLTDDQGRFQLSVPPMPETAPTRASEAVSIDSSISVGASLSDFKVE